MMPIVAHKWLEFSLHAAWSRNDACVSGRSSAARRRIYRAVKHTFRPSSSSNWRLYAESNDRAETRSWQLPRVGTLSPPRRREFGHDVSDWPIRPQFAVLTGVTTIDKSIDDGVPPPLALVFFHPLRLDDQTHTHKRTTVYI